MFWSWVFSWQWGLCYFTAEPNHIPKVKKTVTYIVMAVLFDDKDRVVLVQEAKSSCRGSWYLPAGRVEKGENLVVSLIFSHLVRKLIVLPMGKTKGIAQFGI